MGSGENQLRGGAHCSLSSQADSALPVLEHRFAMFGVFSLTFFKLEVGSQTLMMDQCNAAL